MKNSKDVVKGLQSVFDQNSELQKQVEQMLREKAKTIKTDLLTKQQTINGINFIAERIDLDSAGFY